MLKPVALESNRKTTKEMIMKHTLKTILTVSLLMTTSSSLYAQNYSGSRAWTNSHALASSTCAYSKTRVECAIELTYTLANSIFSHVSYEEFGDTFMPILQSAAVANDTLLDLGAWSHETRDAVNNLIRVLESKERQINKLMTVPAQFDVARKLKSTIRIIKREIL